jgi:hypothetical protein
MLKFNDEGLLVPPSVIPSTLNEFKDFFVIDSPENSRKLLFEQYKLYTNDLKDVCGDGTLRQWIDGSFVTKKSCPLDIDVVTFISFETAAIKERALKDFIYPASLAKYGIDGYIIVVYPENHTLYKYYKADCSYWIYQFDKTKPTRRHKKSPKGFLEIIV